MAGSFLPVFALLLGSATSLSCAERKPPAAAPAPTAVASAPAAPVPPPAPEAAPQEPSPPPSPLRAALLGAHDLERFRAIAADRIRIVDNPGKGQAKTALVLFPGKLNRQLFEHKVKPRLPHEPDPASGDGEEFTCDDAERSCVFADENGKATTYVFSDDVAAPKLREIR